ncbi:hypothetical protein [Streptomyces boninensis]|uniref:hypothetical protein n=1 Tax=Streptomyces boninensis TaxID=2039455 RepID=UPI003B21AF0A
MSWTVPAIVATCALAFTIGSFWWMNERRGRLRSYAPHTFGAWVKDRQLFVHLPLVIYNTGPKPLIVQNLRLCFSDGPAGIEPLLWNGCLAEARKSHIAKNAKPAIFSVPGRQALQLFVDFGSELPQDRPHKEHLCDRTATIEAMLGDRDAWGPLVRFTLQLGRVQGPYEFGMYRNDRG